MTPTRAITLPLILAAFAAVVLAISLVVIRGCYHGSDVPHTDGPVAVKPDSEVVRDRPKTERTFTDRIVKKRVRPKVAVSETPADTGRSENYAALADSARAYRRLVDSLSRARAQGDTTAHPDRVPVPKSVLPPANVRIDGRGLSVWAVRSDGRDTRADVRLGLFRPRVEITLGMDRESDSIPVIDVDRWYAALAKQAVRCVPRSLVLGGGLGALGEALRPAQPGEGRDVLRSAVLGGGLVLVGCIVG